MPIKTKPAKKAEAKMCMKKGSQDHERSSPYIDEYPEATKHISSAIKIQRSFIGKDAPL